MKASAVVREAWLNITSGTTRAALFSVALTVVVVFCCFTDIITIGMLNQQAARFQSAGGSTIIYRAPAGIDGAACDALRTVPGIRASGAVRVASVNVTASSLPGQSIPTFDISSGFGGFQALGLHGEATGVLVSDEAAAALGVEAGGVLRTTGGTATVGAIYRYADDGRQPGYGYAVMIPTENTSPFDQCWIETWPVSNELNALLATTLVPGAGSSNGSGNGPQIEQLNSSLGTSFDGQSLFRGRITRFAPWVAATLALLLGFLSVWVRRMELAAARHSGISVTAQAAQLGMEAAGWIGAAVLIATSTTLVLCRYVPETVDVAVRTILAGSLPAFVGCGVAVASVRERLLFTYFKDR